MDFPDYEFEDLGLFPLDFDPLDFDPYLEDGILLPICWLDDDEHFLSIP